MGFKFHKPLDSRGSKALASCHNGVLKGASQVDWLIITYLHQYRVRQGAVSEGGDLTGGHGAHEAVYKELDGFFCHSLITQVFPQQLHVNRGVAVDRGRSELDGADHACTCVSLVILALLVVDGGVVVVLALNCAHTDSVGHLAGGVNV